MITSSVIKIINNVNALLQPEERYMLFSLVFAYKPKSCLEIGTYKGGSAKIIHTALRLDKNPASLVCVDLHLKYPKSELSNLSNIHFLEGYSQNILREDKIKAYAPFDFVFIDGSHERPDIDLDIQNVIPLLADEALILFHDAYYVPIASAIKDNLHIIPNFLISKRITLDKVNPDISWGGLQLAYYKRAKINDT